MTLTCGTSVGNIPPGIKVPSEEQKQVGRVQLLNISQSVRTVKRFPFLPVITRWCSVRVVLRVTPALV